MYILNIGNQQAQKHLQSVIEYLVEDCGFELLKPDFLYTIYHKNSAMSESAILLHNFLRSIKENHPNVYTLACGCPLIPAVGAVDSIRIGPDTIIPHFDGLPLLANWFHAKRLRQVVDNIEARSWTRTFWNLDPDAFVCRPTIGLSEQQIHSLAQAVRSAKGNIFLGDNMIKLSQEHVEKFIMPLLN